MPRLIYDLRQKADTFERYSFNILNDKGVRALRGYFAPPPPELKSDCCFSTISSDWFIFMVAMVTKMADKTGFK